jgi:hypothetical protein
MNVLVDDELELGTAVHAHPFVGVEHCTHEAAAVAVEEVHLRAARLGINVLREFKVDPAAAEPLAVPLVVALENGVGQVRAV